MCFFLTDQELKDSNFFSTTPMFLNNCNHVQDYEELIFFVTITSTPTYTCYSTCPSGRSRGYGARLLIQRPQGLHFDVGGIL